MAWVTGSLGFDSFAAIPDWSRPESTAGLYWGPMTNTWLPKSTNGNPSLTPKWVDHCDHRFDSWEVRGTLVVRVPSPVVSLLTCSMPSKWITELVYVAP